MSLCLPNCGATLHFTHSSTVTFFFKDVALLLSVTTPCASPEITRDSLVSVPLSLMFRHSFPTWHSVEVQEVAKEEVLQESQDECISTPSMVQERSDCTQPSGDGTCASDEPKVGPAADGACAGSHAKEDDVPTPHPGSHNPSRLSKVFFESRPCRYMSVQVRGKMDYETQTPG